ncbi:MAG: hypothetical protein NPIRA04_16210 [Nitrospirales bacterium]|nr:MAG: hypothetical protein NPIRA04_16210 [Nitrospirales bacterium]
MNETDHPLFTLLQLRYLLVGLMGIAVVCYAPHEVNASAEGHSLRVTSASSIHKAAQAVDTAWEEFHRSAIEGTLASPTLQSQIEQQLHNARGLVMSARKAGRKGDFLSVQRITHRVIDLSKTIIASSREKKQ